jgi:hypothetical protein
LDNNLVQQRQLPAAIDSRRIGRRHWTPATLPTSTSIRPIQSPPPLLRRKRQEMEKVKNLEENSLKICAKI